MTYKRPAGVKYTTMAIYIDEHVYDNPSERDDVKIYEYCYHLINMLAHQGGYFKNAQYYDDFAVMGATRVFLRLRNPKQFEEDENGNPKLEKIVSVLNYIKSIIYPMKVVFERENFKQVSAYDTEDEEKAQEYQSEYSGFHDSLEDAVDQLSLIDFDLYLHEVHKTARALIEKIPHKKDDPEWMNIYLSCLLSFLNSVTLNNKIAEKIKAMRIVLLQKPEILDKLYKEERKDCIILFHLPESMRGYITVLVNRLRHLIARDLSYTAHSHTSTTVNAKNLLRASLEEEDFDGYEDA